MKNTFFFIFILLLLSCSDNRQSVTDSLPRSTPEAEGVDSEGIIRYLEAIKDRKQEMHSIMILRHGKVIAEGWGSPFSDTLNHVLYSVTKTFTSTAIGFAVSEKLLSVDDKVIKFFPESLPDTISPHLESLSVKHLLSMSTGQDPKPGFMMNDTNSVKTFLAGSIVHEPGSVFLYDSYASHILSAIIQKVSGQTTHDYLQSRLFEPLAIKNIDWKKDNSGVNIGGWGLDVKTEDLAKLGQFYLQKGKWNGKQLLPEAWIEEATSMKIEQHPEWGANKKAGSDWAQGYCYQIWRSRHGFRADGASGQYIVVLPQQDVVVAITSNSDDMARVLSLIWDCLLSAFYDKPLPQDLEKAKRLKEKIALLALPLIGKQSQSPLEKVISGKTYKVASNDENVENLIIRFDNDICVWTLEEGGNRHVFNLGKGFYPVVFGEKQSSGSCFWEDDNTLLVKTLNMSGGDSPSFTFKFNGNKISIIMKGSDFTLEGEMLNP